MLNIRNFFKKNLPGNLKSTDFQDNKNPCTAAENSTYLNNRIGQIYGDDLIRLQLLYESWVIKESWLIMDEAIPLLAGFDPAVESNHEQEVKTSLDEIWKHAKHCVEQELLQVINREEAPEKWRARPVDIYRWARTSRIQLPGIFANLMEFISSTIKHAVKHDEASVHNDHADFTAMKFDNDRERVLGVALAVLAAYPEKCRNSKGKVKTDKIINLINEKAAYWSGEQKIEMSPVAMKDLINKWLNTVYLQID